MGKVGVRKRRGLGAGRRDTDRRHDKIARPVTERRWSKALPEDDRREARDNQGGTREDLGGKGGEANGGGKRSPGGETMEIRGMGVPG